jgi:hypothetical protein
MKLLFRLLLLGGLLGLGVWLWIYLHPTPQEAIRRQLVNLAEAASFENGEGLVARAAASQKLASFFAAHVIMNIEPRGIFGEEVDRTEIAERAFQLRSFPDIDSFKVKILDPVITLGADNKSAIVELTIHAETVGERHLIVQEMKFMMKEVDDEWYIFRVETVRTLNQRAPLAPEIEMSPAA